MKQHELFRDQRYLISLLNTFTTLIIFASSSMLLARSFPLEPIVFGLPVSYHLSLLDKRLAGWLVTILLPLLINGYLLHKSQNILLLVFVRLRHRCRMIFYLLKQCTFINLCWIIILHAPLLIRCNYPDILQSCILLLFAEERWSALMILLIQPTIKKNVILFVPIIVTATTLIDLQCSEYSFLFPTTWCMLTRIRECPTGIATFCIIILFQLLLIAIIFLVNLILLKKFK